MCFSLMTILKSFSLAKNIFSNSVLYIPINLISITKTFDQLQKIIELVLYLIKLNPNNIFI